jgi:predicted GTPase
MHFYHRAYLENELRKRVPLEGTPIRFLVKKSRGRKARR